MGTECPPNHSPSRTGRDEIHCKILTNVQKIHVNFGKRSKKYKYSWFIVEAKYKDTKIATSFKYFRKQLNIPFAYQVVEKKDVDFLKDEIRVVSVDRFLVALV